MCSLCEMRDQIEKLRKLSGGDPLIEAEIRVMENMSDIRIAIDENTQMADAILGNPNIGAGTHARFAEINRHMSILNNAITQMSADMMKVIAQGMPTAHLDTRSGKIH